MSRSGLKRAGRHAVLIFGSALFALPFIWLVSTSLKWDRELFMEPSSWFDRLRPRLPYRVLRTPYIAERDTQPFQKPSSMDERKWEALKESLESLLWEEAQQVLTGRDYPDAARNALRTHVARDLWRQIAAEKPNGLWNESAEMIKAEIADSVSYEKIESAWSRLYRSIRLGTPSVQSLDRSEYKAAGGKWNASRGGSLISPREMIQEQEIWTDYQRAPAPPYASYYAYEIASPVQLSGLAAVIVPIRADESYHHFTAEVEMNGETYVSKKPFILQNYGWNETLFQLRGEPLDREAIPLEKTDRASSVVEPGRVKIVLTLHRAPYLLAAYRKFSRNYYEASSFVSFWRYVLNTAMVTALSVAAQLLSCSLAAYAFARLRWPGRDKLFFLLICTMMLPPQVTMVPLFILARNLGLYDTLHPLWGTSLFGSAFFIFLMRQFLLGAPRDLEDAAKLDGCGFFGLYWRVILPLVKPALAAVAVLQFMGAWNDFLSPLIYISSESKMTLSLGLQLFESTSGAEYGMLMAASTVMTLPVAALFFFAQRYFIQGITLTGIRG